MKRYRLIKEYPGSPDLNTVVEKELRSSCSYFYRGGDKRYCVLNDHVENNPEYWKEMNENIWYVVFDEDYDMFESWYPYCLETCTKYKNMFRTKREAEDFINHNKPCLSFNDIMWEFNENPKKNTVSIDVDNLVKLVRSKI